MTVQIPICSVYTEEFHPIEEVVASAANCFRHSAPVQEAATIRRRLNRAAGISLQQRPIRCSQTRRRNFGITVAPPSKGYILGALKLDELRQNEAPEHGSSKSLGQGATLHTKSSLHMPAGGMIVTPYGAVVPALTQCPSMPPKAGIDPP